MDSNDYPTPVVFEPTEEHTHSIIMLHGRGSSGPEFAEDFFSSAISIGSKPVRLRFPNFRWIFPSSRELWSTAFQETMPAWFEAHSLTDISSRSDLQIRGLTESVKHIHRIIDYEISLLEGNSHALMMGGISQGAAIGIWSLITKVDNWVVLLVPVAGCHSPVI